MSLSIIDFNDYVDFLKDFVHFKKDQNKGWSYNVWARQLEIGDPSLLRKVSKGLRTPNQEVCSKLIDYFKFSKEESDFFSVLVELRKINIDDKKRNEILEGFRNSILSEQFKEPKRDVIPMHTTWKHTMLYSFAMLGQGMSLELIKEAAYADLNDSEILETINDLIKMGLLDFDEEGKLIAKEKEGLVVKRKCDETDPDYLKKQAATTRSFIEALRDNVLRGDIPYLSFNVISKIPRSEYENFREEVKSKVLEVLFKYDQMESGDSYELFNLYLAGYSVFKVNSELDNSVSSASKGKDYPEKAANTVSKFFDKENETVCLMSADEV